MRYFPLLWGLVLAAPLGGQERVLRPGIAIADGPLDWVLDKVSSGKDEWLFEKFNDELNARLKELAGRITALDLTATSLQGLLAPGFRYHGALAAALDSTLNENGLEVERTELAEPAAVSPEVLDAAGFAVELRAALRDPAQMEKAKFKVFRIHRSGEPPRVTTRVVLEADGVLPGSTRVQMRAVWDVAWVEMEGVWLLAEVRSVSLERARLKARPFTDVTRAALAGNDCFDAQLGIGLDGWRTRLDSASGIDIYGHQGVSIGDFDGDGWEDFYVAQPAGLPNRLFHNRGDGTFHDVTARAGLGVLDTTGGTLFVDLDGDGDLDLVVVTALEILAFENLGEGRFQRRHPTGLEGAGQEGASSMGCVAADFDRDSDLDLYCVSYIFWAGAGTKTHSSYPYPYHDAENGAPNFLFRNEGDFRFTDVTVPSGMDRNNRRFSLAAAWCDYDDDGDPDVYVANDFGRNNLYQNQGDGTFKDVAREAGVEDVGNGMSVTWEDYDNDGRIDLYVGNMWSSAGNRIAEQPGFGRAGSDLQATYRRMARGNSLFRNLGDGRFEDVSIASGSFFGRWSWSCQFIDHDANGREDLYVANGFVTNEGVDDL